MMNNGRIGGKEAKKKFSKVTDVQIAFPGTRQPTRDTAARAADGAGAPLPLAGLRHAHCYGNEIGARTQIEPS
jgi:hypothetical protein